MLITVATTNLRNSTVPPFHQGHVIFPHDDDLLKQLAQGLCPPIGPAMAYPILTANDANALDKEISYLERYMYDMSNRMSIDKREWFKVARTIAQGNAKIIFEYFFVMTFQTEDKYGEALRHQTRCFWEERWRDLMDRFADDRAKRIFFLSLRYPCCCSIAAAAAASVVWKQHQC